MKTKEELVELIGQKTYKPQTYQELLQTFNYSGKDTGALLRILDELEEDGSLFKTKKGKYVLPIQFGYIAGTLSKHKRGFGFVIPTIPGDGDIFISNKDLAGAMHGDKVMTHLSDNPDKSRSREGEIVKVLKRASDEIVGTLETVKNFGFVVPDDPKISEDVYVSDNNFNKAQAGDKVVVKITRWPQKNQKAEGKITEKG
jgi:ribonuclease R